MKILYYDCFCGISGDMNLGALVDLGVDFDYLQNELQKLNINEEFKLIKSTSNKMGISGTKIDVQLMHQQNNKNYMHTHEDHNHEDHGHTHEDHSHEEHGHTHEDHSHEDHGHTHEEHSHEGHNHIHEEHSHKSHAHNHHEHRNFQVISEMINRSDLKDQVKKLSIEIFRLVAVAEGKVHGKLLEEVHFHEVGATDSIVDIVGAAICLDALDVDEVQASSIHVGGGFVKCAHGMMPVPAPATAEILTQVPIVRNRVQFETTTPTGAAILKATVKRFDDQPTFEIIKIGYGIGNKDFDIPNVLRVYIGEERKVNKQAEDLELMKEEQYLIETNIDDMNGEWFEYVEQLLFEQKVLDVYKTPIMMKKNRLATKLSVLFKEEQREEVMDIVFRYTSAAGLRETKVNKYMLKREMTTITTKYGDVRVKHLYYKNAPLKSKPEYDDCLKLAKDHKCSLQEIQNEVIRILNN